MRPSTDELAASYVGVKRAVVEHGYSDEIAWQFHAARDPLSRQRFLREAAWVVLCTGMRESVIRQAFQPISAAFLEFDPEQICNRRARVRAAALRCFRNARKIDAILDIAGIIRHLTPTDLSAQLSDPQGFLESLPYVGPVTWRHLAKNLGISVAKPDRHLTRIAALTGRNSVDELCGEISDWTGEPIEVVDLVLWRWCVVRRSECIAGCHPGENPAFRIAWLDVQCLVSAG